MELQGFKSFADKTEITFQDGITVIVGPNGCGKSNVAEAVKWVLGDQRPSAMRGKSMTDVIFKGTEARRSLSYAEVNLYFDNKNRIFPIESDDVVLGRKIDRSGVGEYFINKQKCRLKDVITLLHDTGIGREGYSIVGQGRVAQIIQAKPIDRRSIFEEAAGIANFKAQKDETFCTNWNFGLNRWQSKPARPKSTTLFIRNLKTPKSITLFIVTKTTSPLSTPSRKNSKKSFWTP